MMSTSVADNAYAAEVTRVPCTYTTVFRSRASYYYAVAPTKPYAKMLRSALEDDVERMIIANGGGGACCGVDTRSGSMGAVQRSEYNAATSSRLPLCVCVEGVAITDVRKRFNRDPELLGVTFRVNLSVWESASPAGLAARADALRRTDKPAQLSALARDVAVSTAAGLCPGGTNCHTRETGDRDSALVLSGASDNTATRRAGAFEAYDALSSSAAGRDRTRRRTAVANTLNSSNSSVVVGLSDSQPLAPFVWSLRREDAFPRVRQNLLKALTRKDYLSAYKREVHVFAHTTLSDLSRMLSMRLPPSSSNSSTAQARIVSSVVGSTGVPLDAVGVAAARTAQRHALSTERTLAASETEGADYCLILAASGSSIVPPPGNTGVPITIATKSLVWYPSAVVQVAQNTYTTDSFSGTSAAYTTGAVCTVVMVVLILCAIIGYVHQRWRRRREERADERKLLQRELR
uniref:Uncharacterized protein n=1 Tax=Leishmania guyanensis TaxID=5670 RepID=A0A1E1IN59_LEIGU|nr:Hypothetical protein BN36_0201020 [Leishmania guyanensis]